LAKVFSQLDVHVVAPQLRHLVNLLNIRKSLAAGRAAALEFHRPQRANRSGANAGIKSELGADRHKEPGCVGVATNSKSALFRLDLLTSS
jgi:hypothetical protein